jgi:hypothetical protein
MFGLITGVLLTTLANTPYCALRQRRRQIFVKSRGHTPALGLRGGGRFFKFHYTLVLATAYWTKRHVAKSAHSLFIPT